MSIPSTPVRFHQIPLVIVLVAEFASDSLHQTSTLTKINRLWFSVISGESSSNHHQQSAVAVAHFQLWRKSFAFSLFNLSKNHQHVGCSLPNFEIDADNKKKSVPDYLLHQMFSALIGRKFSSRFSIFSPKIATGIEFCLVASEENTKRFVLKPKVGDENDDEILEYFADDDADADKNTTRFLGSATPLHSKNILRFKFISDEAVVGCFDVGISREDDEDDVEDSSKTQQLPKIFKILNHCNVNSVLSNEERQDEDVVLFDRVECLYIDSSSDEIVDDDEDQITSCPVLKCVIIENGSSKKLNMIRFVMEELERKGLESSGERHHAVM